MGDVLLLYRISVEDQDLLDKVHEEIKKIKGYTASQIEDFVFGLKIIKAKFIVPDKVDGAIVDLENSLKGIEGVSSIENEATTLI